MVSTHLGKLSEGRINTLRGAIGEDMIGQLVEAETLFYAIVDVIGVGPQTAQEIVLYCFSGGDKVSAKRISDVTNEIKGKTYGFSTRRVHQFMKRYMKSTRIELISKQPQVWQMNGFSTFEPPYICGYERSTIESLMKHRNEIKQKIDAFNEEISTFPDNFVELVHERQELQEKYENINTMMKIKLDLGDY